MICINLLLNGLVYIIEAIIAIVFLQDIFYSKCKTVRIWVTGFSLYALLMLINILFDNNTYINIISIVLVHFVFACLCFECSWKSSFVASIIVIVAITGAEFLSMCILSFAFSVDINAYADNEYIYFLVVTFSKTIYFMICKLLSFSKLLSKVNNFKKSHLYLFIYPICSVIVFLIFWRIATEFTLSNQILFLMSFSSMVILVSVIVTYVLFTYATKNDMKLYELQSELDRISIDEAYYSILDKQNNELKEFAHDEKNHLMAIKCLANNPEVDKYIDSIYHDLKRYSVSGNTNNKMLDLILNKYALLSEVENVKFSYTIRTSNLSFMENSDLIALLSNILDNAIDAAKSSEEKAVELSLNKVNGFDMLTCINSCDTKPDTKGSELITTKKNKRLHGIGVRSIKRIVGKYNGNYDWTYDNDKKEFSTFVMFEGLKN